MMMKHRPREAPAPKPPKPRRALLFHPFRGQGFGNVVNGLLSAHLLADEYDRIVCVDAGWADFLRAFRPTHTEDEAAFCEREWYLHKSTKREAKDRAVDCKIVNFSAGTLNECSVRACLSHEGPITFTGNAYPRWAHVGRDYFAARYQPTELLEAVLPWHPDPPDVVVHLRKGDTEHDQRKGLDEDTFHALGRMLPNNTFLVTNRVGWYDWFGDKYGWRNSGWFEVKHSFNPNRGWGRRGGPDQQKRVETEVTNRLNITVEQLHELNMYSDWWTLAKAKERVLHTYSDFSLSAVHWMNKESKTIMGMRKATEEDLAEHPDLKVGDKMLDLVDEDWVRDGETPRLVDRTLDMLKNCDEKQLNKLKGKAAKEAARGKADTIIGDDDNPLRGVELPDDLQMRFDSRQYAYFNPKSTRI
jgi:hypothetical protein